MNEQFSIVRGGRRVIALLAVVLVSVLAATTALAVNSYLNDNFDTTPVLAETDTDGAWYVDRYPPAAFESVDFGGENVLKISISEDDGAQQRTGGLSSGFYNTHGRKFNQSGLGVTRVEGDLYIPADWATSIRRSDLWATAYNASDAISFYPIMGFRNVDGSSPEISYWDGADWVEMGPPPTYDTWYTIGMELDGTDVVYKLDGAEVGRVDSNGSVYYGNIILQAYNFNDSSLPAENYDPNSTYDAYWDNIKTSTNFYNATQQTYHATIQAAIDAATAGDTINVAAGTYAENVNVNKTLTLNGPNQGVAGNSPSRVAEATVTSFNIGAADVTIDGFAIAEGAVLEGSPSGIYVKSFPNVTIRNNKLTRTGSYDSYRAIQTVTSPSLANLTIEDNFATGWATGAYLNPQASGVVSGNVFESNFVGMSFDNPDGILVVNNKFLNNGFEGVGIGDLGGGKPVDVTFLFNVFSGNAAGLGNYSSTVVNAINNWWGDASGPSGEGTGAGDSVSTNVDFTPWLGADLEEVAFGELGLTDSLSGPGNSSATNTTPSGPSNFLVILSKFAGNPTSAPNFAAAGNYFDIFVSGATTTDSLEVVLPADGDGNLYYYNGTAWAPVLENGVPVTPSNNLYTFTLDDNSTPKLTALNETPFAGAGNEEIRISTPNNTVSAGQTFQVVVEAGSDALFGVDVSMTFDADELEVTSIALGNGLQPGTIAVNTYDNAPPGTLQFAYSQLGSSEANVSGTNLMLATITFLAHTAGDTSVTLGNALFTDKDGNPATPAPLDSPINLTVNPSPSVYVDVALQGRSDHAGLELQVSPVGPGNVLYDNTVVAGRLQIPTVPSGTYEARVSAPKYLAAIQTFTVSTQSEYDLNGVNGASPSGLILALRGGDINGDDQINIQDLVLIGVVFGDNTPSSDINGDGVVNIQDLAIAAGNFDLETGVDDYPDYPNNLWD